MNKALVAKSYQNCQQITDIYTVNGKDYVKVMTKSGPKQVRAYTQSEYDKFNPPIKIIQPAKSRRDVLGFGEAGYIWLFKGNTYENIDWFRASSCKYNKLWGWYLSSSEKMPEPLPANISPVKLNWDEISFDGQLIDDKQIKEITDKLLYDANPSVFVGKVGDKVEFDCLCSKMSIQQGVYGLSYFYIFKSDDNNIFTWGTSSKMLEEGQRYHICGTVKGHNTYKNIQQTNLKNCRVTEEG